MSHMLYQSSKEVSRAKVDSMKTILYDKFLLGLLYPENFMIIKGKIDPIFVILEMTYLFTLFMKSWRIMIGSWSVQLLFYFLIMEGVSAVLIRLIPAGLRGTHIPYGLIISASVQL